MTRATKVDSIRLTLEADDAVRTWTRNRAGGWDEVGVQFACGTVVRIDGRLLERLERLVTQMARTADDRFGQLDRLRDALGKPKEAM